MSHSNTLSINDLRCTRGERALFSGLNALVSSGQCLHITGANGSGKTSLLRILSGLNRPEHGSVMWGQEDINANPEFLAACAFVGHKDGLKNELTAIENLRFSQQLNDTLNEDKLDDCLIRMRILPCADLYAHQLSFGQRRRLALAALLLKPYKLWILDEPLTGIDIEGRELIEQLFVEHLKQQGMIILTHHQSLQHSALDHYLQELHLGLFDPEAVS